MGRTLFLLSLLICLLPWEAAGQERAPPLTIQVDSTTGSAMLQLGDILAQPEIGGAVDSGLPIRILVEAELFRDRFLGGQEGRAEWRATVVKDPLEDRFVIQRGDSPGDQQVVASLGEVRAILSTPLSLALQPPSPGRYYYQGMVEVETLSLTDLEELQRWLRGELGPAISGEGEMEGAVNRGLRRIFIRMLGLPVRRYQTRSPSFNYPP
ncbi:MAG: hypothetical protein WEA09_01575 [Gemmatimonadota bacterium]